MMKTSAVAWGGIVGGLAAVAVVISAGQMLGVSIISWRSAIVLAPAGIVLGLALACVCALAFEFVTQRGGWLRGAFIGLVFGAIAASIAGLVPWAASWFAYAYMPGTPPLGSADPSWPLVAIVAAGLVNGVIAGAWYGTPIHASTQRPVRWREVYSATRVTSRS